MSSHSVWLLWCDSQGIKVRHRGPSVWIRQGSPTSKIELRTVAYRHASPLKISKKLNQLLCVADSEEGLGILRTSTPKNQLTRLGTFFTRIAKISGLNVIIRPKKCSLERYRFPLTNTSCFEPHEFQNLIYGPATKLCDEKCSACAACSNSFLDRAVMITFFASHSQ